MGEMSELHESLVEKVAECLSDTDPEFYSGDGVPGFKDLREGWKERCRIPARAVLALIEAEIRADEAVLRAQVAELRKALKPFVDATEYDLQQVDEDIEDGIPGYEDTENTRSDYWALKITIGELRRARAALEMSGGVK